MVKIQVLGTFHRFILANQDKRKLVIYGGAGSGKSVAVAQWIVKQFHDGDNLRILCIRKTLPSLRITSYLLIKDILNQAGIIYEENKSELTLKHRNNTIFFKSIDDPEKVKSFEANLIWVEEATELSKEDYLQLDLRTRRAGSNQIILTFNPIDAFHWAITDLVQKPDPTVAVHHSTYKDNRFLPQAYIDTLESLIDQDYNYYRIYTLGEPGVLENTVYSQYKIEDISNWPDACRAGTPSRLGIDFGFNDPTVIVSLKVHDNENYVKELLYKPKLTNSDLISFLHSTFRTNKWPYSLEIVCDSAEPNRIEELCRAGFNAVPANKDIKFGIDQVKSRKLHLDAEAVNGIKEIRAYSYKKNKDGRVLDEPIDAFNHFCDAMRYAISTGASEGKPNSSRLGKLIIR